MAMLVITRGYPIQSDDIWNSASSGTGCEWVLGMLSCFQGPMGGYPKMVMSIGNMIEQKWCYYIPGYHVQGHWIWRHLLPQAGAGARGGDGNNHVVRQDFKGHNTLEELDQEFNMSFELCPMSKNVVRYHILYLLQDWWHVLISCHLHA